jgi:lipoprotein-anchoring transpeptidase ErfK/SrfK
MVGCTAVKKDELIINYTSKPVSSIVKIVDPTTTETFYDNDEELELELENKDYNWNNTPKPEKIVETKVENNEMIKELNVSKNEVNYNNIFISILLGILLLTFIKK